MELKMLTYSLWEWSTMFGQLQMGLENIRMFILFNGGVWYRDEIDKSHPLCIAFQRRHSDRKWEEPGHL
jgi:hypothetical protein